MFTNFRYCESMMSVSISQTFVRKIYNNMGSSRSNLGWFDSVSQPALEINLLTCLLHQALPVVGSLTLKYME